MYHSIHISDIYRLQNLCRKLCSCMQNLHMVQSKLYFNLIFVMKVSIIWDFFVITSFWIILHFEVLKRERERGREREIDRKIDRDRQRQKYIQRDREGINKIGRRMIEIVFCRISCSLHLYKIFWFLRGWGCLFGCFLYSWY